MTDHSNDPLHKVWRKPLVRASAAVAGFLFLSGTLTAVAIQGTARADQNGTIAVQALAEASAARSAAEDANDQLRKAGKPTVEIPVPTVMVPQQGPAGQQGIQGLPGPKGDKGDPGDDSNVPGPQGKEGINGKDGRPGRDSTIPGPKGDKGDQGQPGSNSTIPGPKGDQGNPGADSTVPGPKGDTGDQGTAGKDGQDGKNGTDGAAGKDGKDGSDGKPIAAIRCAPEGQLEYRLEGSDTWSPMTNAACVYVPAPDNP